MNTFLKAAHLLFACLWLGGTASVAVLQGLRGWAHDGRSLAALNLDLGLLALALIVPGALGSLLTGFLHCQATGWQIMHSRWVVAKWIGALCGLLVGSMLFLPWQIRLINLSGELVDAPIAGGAYALLRVPFTIVAFLQVYLLMTMVAVAVLKPWGERLPRSGASSSRRPARRALSTQRRPAAAPDPLASDLRS